jgi:hypothetical protein
VKLSAPAAFAAAVLASSLYASISHAEVIAAAMRTDLCLDVNQGNNQVALWQCHGGANQSFFGGYGPQRFNNLCLDQANPNQGAGLVMAPCANKPSQRWGMVDNPNDANALGSLRNESGWCANIPGGNANQGVQVIVWTCSPKMVRGRSNDVWIRGNLMQAGSAGVPAAALARLANPNVVYTPSGRIISQDGASIVAQGGGNIVAQGGGNIVAQGGGNIVAAGAGNVIAASGGAIVAAGAGN